MNSQSDYDFFGKESISKILLKVSPPVMLAQLIQALYNIVDSFFCRQIFRGCAYRRYGNLSDAAYHYCTCCRYGCRSEYIYGAQICTA